MIIKEIQKSIFNILLKEPFFGLLLQEINIRVTLAIPTAGMSYDKKLQKFFVYINPEFFINTLSEPEREAVLIHELLHFLHRHIFDLRMPEDWSTKDNKIKANLAMDMAINQYIQNLPKSCVNVNDWKMDDGTPFPKLKPFEVYYQLIKDSNGKEGSKSNTNEPTYDKYVGQDGESLDQHDFDSLTDEEKKEALKEAKKTLQRTIEKSSYGHSIVPDYVKDILQELDTLIERINYKTLLQSYIKKSLSLFERTGTWNKPSRKFGYYAKGTKVGELPKVEFYIDSSGSISHTEINEFLSVIDGILKIGQKKCQLHKWHTAVYNSQRYKNGMRLNESDLESGGTDVDPVITMINKSAADLSIILTDGFFDLPRVKTKNQNILWVISKNGNTDKTFLDNLVGKKIKIS